METFNVGVGKGKSLAMEGRKDHASTPAKNNNAYVRPFDVKCYRCIDVERFFIIPINVLHGRQ